MRAMNQMRLTKNGRAFTKKSLIFSQIKFVFIELAVLLIRTTLRMELRHKKHAGSIRRM